MPLTNPLFRDNHAYSQRLRKMRRQCAEVNATPKPSEFLQNALIAVNAATMRRSDPVGRNA